MDSNIIKLLPDSVANQIAAGEVIQRPASVVKELVENAVDAGATSISIVIKDAGRTLVQVVDNGCGMSPVDARMAFERHATSKIANATDLYALHTMGFRGEALPSIASVAQIELRTMRKGDEMGSKLCLSESKFISQEPVVATPGSNLMVKNLFFNMPARRKFLKKDSVELGHILREFERLALVNPGIDFTLISNDVTLHQLRHATEKQRIIDLFGKAIDRALLPIGTAAPFVRIEGYIGLPSSAKKRGYQQFFSVNGRNMRHPFFHRAVMDCYQALIASDVQPSYFINFEVNPENIDVNIHPQKHEIKFEDEIFIRDVLMAAIKESLGRFNVSGAMDFDVEDAPDIPAFDPRAGIIAPDTAVDSNYNPFADTPSTARPSRINSDNAPATHNRTPRAATNWEALYQNFDNERAASLDEVRSSALNNDDSEQKEVSLPGLTAIENDNAGHCIQLRQRYIVMPSQSGLMIIDQHRAHVNVLYARFADGGLSGTTQRLIFPDSVELTPSQSASLESMADIAADMGFDIAHLGGGTWAVNGVPADIAATNPAELLAAMADDAAATGTHDTAALRSDGNKNMADGFHEKSWSIYGFSMVTMVHNPSGVYVGAGRRIRSAASASISSVDSARPARMAEARASARAAAERRAAVSCVPVAAASSAMAASSSARHTYITARQNYIDSLSAICRAESSTDEAPYPALAHAYAGFNNDSALSILRRAESSHSKDKQHEARMHMASLLPLAGLFDSAEAKLAEVDTTLIGRESMPAYYEHARQMYSYFAAFFERYPELRQRYASQSMRMQAKLLEVLDPESDEYLFNLGEHAYLNGQNPRARVLLSELLARDTISDMLRARAAHHLSAIAKADGDEASCVYYLVQSTISDLRSATREMASLQELGALLYTRGDIDRAYAYLSTALANAVECGAEVRMLESARSLPYIEQAYARKAAEAHRRDMWIMAGMAVLVIVLIGSLVALRVEMKRMSRLQERLRSANKAKEVYISQFLTLCSVYMDKLKQFSKLVTRKIGAGQVDDLYRMAKNGKFVEEESREFYEVFDNAFLHIYPTFIDEVNALLRPDEQIIPKEGERLNTDLRILAFMRLGIEDSSSIAQVLNYSLNTIYAYRNRLKARAIDRENFERNIMGIGS